MQELIQLLAGREEDVALDLAALQLAQIEYPGSSLEPFLVLLDSHAAEFSERVTEHTDGDEFVGLLNEYLFEELGFQGNQDDYYNPANSCLNEVLTRRLGIPISLSLVYIEIARRLNRTVFGVGLPGHFIVLYDDGDFTSYLDPFHGGALLTQEDCFELTRRITGIDVSNDPEVLRPATKRQILLRMLNNLRAVYFHRQDPKKAVQVLNLLIQADPGSAEEYKQRGICLAQMQAFHDARADLETYLRLAPEAADRDEVARRLEQIRRWSE